MDSINSTNHYLTEHSFLWKNEDKVGLIPQAHEDFGEINDHFSHSKDALNSDPKKMINDEIHGHIEGRSYTDVNTQIVDTDLNSQIVDTDVNIHIVDTDVNNHTVNSDVNSQTVDTDVNSHDDKTDYHISAFGRDPSDSGKTSIGHTGIFEGENQLEKNDSEKELKDCISDSEKEPDDIISVSEKAQSCGSVSPLPFSTITTVGKFIKGSVYGKRVPKQLALIKDGLLGVCFTINWDAFLRKTSVKDIGRYCEMHQIVLGESDIHSEEAVGYMETPIPYSSVEDVHIISRWDAGQKFCIRVTIQDGSLLLQANNSHLRDQWLQSIIWKKHMYKYEKLLKTARRPEVLLKEIKNMIDVSIYTPIQDPSVYQFPLDLVSELLQRNADFITRVAHENIIVALAPLLENNHPTQEICDFFSKHCKNSPRSSIVIELFTPVVQRILKHNMDFGKFPRMRQFVQEYIQALNCQNAGLEVVRDFIRSMHGPASICPHPRVLPNLIAVCLAAVYGLYEEKRISKEDNLILSQFEIIEWEKKVICYTSMMELMSDYEDWRGALGSLLQPIPFPNDALADGLFTSNMKGCIEHIATDKTCDIHQTLLGIREGKEGWFHLYCPGNIGCDDDGELWGKMLYTLMHCCCKRKNFLFGLNKMIGPVMLLSLRENNAAMEVICAMLECDVVESNDLKMQMVTTLQSTMAGKRMYADVCDRQIALRELQQKGGPKKLTLPSKSTDADLGKMLSSGSFGNLECLSLAFTHVTSACADDLIKLPSLRYLNLWSTQFGDRGLQKISEHLHKLQVLNLCETPVTDKGLTSLAALKNLRKLNLNSTNLSALVFEGLKEKLPCLQECDVRYTEAW